MKSTAIHHGLVSALEAEFGAPLTDTDKAGLSQGLSGHKIGVDRPLFSGNAVGVAASERYARAHALGLENAERYQSACVAEAWD